MSSPGISAAHLKAFGREAIESRDHLLRQGISRLLAIKDSDVRIAHPRAMPRRRRQEPARRRRLLGDHSAGRAVLRRLHRLSTSSIPRGAGQDLFVLSKGHAVAALASIYAELGYFDRSVLRNSRSYGSILNGHPGPVLPGIHLATGPDGPGLRGGARASPSPAVTSPRFDCYCLTGDGELQEGTDLGSGHVRRPEASRQSVRDGRSQQRAARHSPTAWSSPCRSWRRCSRSFDWKVHSVDATQYDGVYARARAVPLRAAQRPADGDHLPRHEGARRALGFPEQAQGHGAGRR